MKIIGISGQTGAGKSTLAQYLAKKGGRNIEVDEIGHLVLFDPGIKVKLRKNFGDEIFDSEGEISRAKLGKKAFASKDAITSLNRIMHSEMVHRVIEIIKKDRLDKKKFVLINAALLFSMGLDEFCDKIIYVVADGEVRLKRLIELRGMDKEKAEKRLFAQDQLPENQDNIIIISNNDDEEKMFAQIEEKFRKLIS